LNGAAARLAQCGDKVIIMTFGIYSEDEIKGLETKVILPDEKNMI
jgi:aspartate 1-decarboxylase